MLSGFLKTSADFRSKTLKREGKSRVLREKRNIRVLPPGPLTMVISLVKNNPTSHKTISGVSQPSLGCALLHLPNSCTQSPDSFLGKIPNCQRIIFHRVQAPQRAKNATGHPGREPEAAVPAACEVCRAARALPATKSLPGTESSAPGGMTALQRNLKPNISCHPGHREPLWIQRMPEALGYLFDSHKSSALRNFLGEELNRTQGSSMFV